MLITIISILVLVVGVGLLVYHYVGNSYSDAPGFIGTILAIIGSSATVICLIGVIGTQVTKDVNYENNAERREMLVYRLEHQDENLVGGELLYQEVRDFNEDLRKHKEYCDNPWVNWFYNEKNATFDYIDYKGGNE